MSRNPAVATLLLLGLLSACTSQPASGPPVSSSSLGPSSGTQGTPYPVLTISPTQGPVGTVVHLSGTIPKMLGGTGKMTIGLLRESPGGCEFLGGIGRSSLRVDSAGRVSGEFVVGGSGACFQQPQLGRVPARPGRYRVVLGCTSCETSAMFTVTPSPAAQSASIGRASPQPGVLLFGVGVGPGVDTVSLSTGHIQKFRIPVLHDYPAMQTSSMWSGPLVVGDRAVFVSGPKDGGGRHVFVMSNRLTGPATDLGAGYAVFPAGADALWIGTGWRHEGVATTKVREVNVDGQVLRPGVTVRGSLVGVTAAGFVQMWTARNRTTIALFDMWTGKPLRVISRNAEWLATSATTVAWRAGEYDCTACTLHLTDVVTRADRTVPVPRSLDAPLVDAAFSPDGRTLAMILDRGGEQRGFLALTRVDSGRLSVVPQSAGAEETGLAWDPASRFVFFRVAGAVWPRTLEASVRGGPAKRVFPTPVLGSLLAVLRDR